MARAFLTASWTNVVLVNFRVPPALLLPHVPPGAELDTPDTDPDLHLVSVVALHFANSRVYGIPIPTAQFFPEINVRFYARRGPTRASVFLTEFVPIPVIAVGARLLYHQPYRLARIVHDVHADEHHIQVTIYFERHNQSGEIRLRALNEPEIVPNDSETHFLKEHYWGFDRDWLGRSFRYQVSHPVWRTYPIESSDVALDPGMLLGGHWTVLDWKERLHSVVYAEGSAVTVYEPESLTAELPLPYAEHPVS